MNKKIIVGAALGNCVHVGGVVHFLQLAEKEGYEVHFLGPAIEPEVVIEKALEFGADRVCVGYRLTPENGEKTIDRLIELAKENHIDEKISWSFGGTRPVAEVARRKNFFDFVSDGSDDIDESIAFLRGQSLEGEDAKNMDNLVDRINQKYPYPLLRHHFGLPTMESTVEGIEKIADSKVLDVISLGPDQNTQEYYFRQDEMDHRYDGAGGVPIRTEEDYMRLKEASKRGNYPLMRSYSGTADVIRVADVQYRTLNNCWCAVPLSWYNEMDGRGTRVVEQSVREAQELMKWHAERNIPVEMNEPHHWAMRDGHDVMSVVSAYLAAYNAKKCGVKDYISQYMFNVPNTLNFKMDLARVLAMRDLVESLADDDFRIYRQTRTGLPFMSADLDVAKGQLAASTMLQMAIEPHIIHVVGYSEAEHAASPEVVIESCKIVRGVIRSVMNGASPDMTHDKDVQDRRMELLYEAKILVEFLKEYYKDYEEPLANPDVIADAIKRGILDAVHIVKNEKYIGILKTAVVDGKNLAVDPATDEAISETERIDLLRQNGNLDNRPSFLPVESNAIASAFLRAMVMGQ